MKTIPFVYSVTFKNTGQYYYGYRGRKGCHPDDLWSKYFTSSKIVKELIADYGINAFDFRVRKIFETSEEARAWERKLLVRVDARNNPKMLNQSNGGKEFTITTHTKETREKISMSRRGMVFTDEHKVNIGLASKGRVTSKATKEKISIALSRRIISSETRSKISAAASRRTLSTETRKKISETQIGKKLSDDVLEKRASNKKCLAEGIEYRSLSAAARALGMSSAEAIKYRILTGKEGYKLL